MTGLDELLRRIRNGEYDPAVSGADVEFYCLIEDYGINPDPRTTEAALEAGTRNPTYGRGLTPRETVFVDYATVERAMGAGWLLSNPIPTPIRTQEGQAVPRTKSWFDHVDDYKRGHGLTRAGVDAGRDVWQVNTKWMIDVPEGYSLLYAHPFNYATDTFRTIPGILDADQFPYWFRVPVEIYVKDGNVQFDDPLAQVIPFERSDAPLEASVEVVDRDELSSGPRESSDDEVES